MSMDIAVTGIQAAGMRLAVSAHNVANVNTEGFKARRAVHRELPNQRGTMVYSVQTDQATDLAVEMVDQLYTLRYMQANVAAFRVSAQMHGHLIDMWA